MSRVLFAGPLLLVPLLPMAASAQTVAAVAEIAAPVPMAKLFPTAPVARRIDPIVPSFQRSRPSGVAAVASKVARGLTAFVVPKPVPVLRPVQVAPSTTAIAAIPDPVLLKSPTPAVNPAMISSAAPVQATQVATAVDVQKPIAVFTCKWGQDYSDKLKRCVSSTSPLAAAPKPVLAQRPAVKSGVTSVAAKTMPMGVTVAPTPLMPGAIAAGISKQTETVIVGALKTARTKVAKSKSPLDTTTRMSLGAKKAK